MFWTATPCKLGNFQTAYSVSVFEEPKRKLFGAGTDLSILNFMNFNIPVGIHLDTTTKNNWVETDSSLRLSKYYP